MIPFGDLAVRFSIPEGTSRRRLFAELSVLPGVADVVLAEEIGCVVFEDVSVDRTPVARALSARPVAEDDATGTSHVVPVIYDGEDLDAVARTLGRSMESVIALHSGADYRVSMLGFLPGFAYLRGLPSELRLPRRAPRLRVPRGSVAIAADYTAVYPFSSPGGWHLLGRASGIEPFGPRGAAFAIGDRVRFVPTSIEAPAPAAEPVVPAATERPHLEITRASGFAVLVDGGRRGRMHEGVPPGGPLVRSSLARANALAGNAPSACAVELAGTFEVIAKNGPVECADDGAAFTLAEGERRTISTEGRSRVRYLSLAGGIDAPVVLGGRGSLLVAGIGGLLRKGHRLLPAARAEAALVAPLAEALSFAPDAPIAFMSGPDAPEGFSDALTKRAFRIGAASDRTGTRLEALDPAEHLVSSPLASTQAAARRSTPMVIGAIELTPSGLIVLGPDHPTTGGYPVVAVVRDASLDDLFARPIGSRVRLS